MVLEQPIVWVIVAAAGVLAAVTGVLIGRRASGADRSATGVPVARAERVRALPSVQRAVRRRMLGLALVVVLAAAGVLTAGVVAARPMHEKLVQPETRSRDVMLCLDVSGSMTDVDAEVLKVFSELAENFAGERIGLTIFNSSPVQVFPLTDDYALARESLDRVRGSFDRYEAVPEFWVGTLNAPGASLVGDGVAACALGFDHPDEERARSIILATDNEVRGTETMTLEQAASYAGSLGVRLYAIDPVAEGSGTGQGLRQAARSTGGAYFGLHDDLTIDSIVEQVKAEDATVLQGEARMVTADAPGGWTVVVAVLALAFVVVAGRWRI